MTDNLNPTSTRKPLLVGLLAALLFLALGFFMLWQRYQILLENRQSEMAGIIELVEQNIEQSLKYSYSAVLSLALQIDENGKIENFDTIAAQLVDSNPNIDAIQIVPNGVITKVYPYKEHQAALNYDILNEPKTREEALKAIESRKMYFAGPLQLKQGGLAIVGRLPVFIENDFWGFAAVLIYFENLIDQSGIRDLASDKYKFQFSKTDPVSGKEQFFLQETSELKEAYSEEVLLPDGDWKIYIIPVNPLEPFYAIIPVGLLILVFSAAMGWIIFNTMKQPAILAAKVKKQAGDLAKSELQFRTIFNQAAIGMARVDSNTGMILETNNKFQELLGYSNAELNQKDHIAISYPEDRKPNIELMEKLRNNEIREYNLKKRLVKKDGEIIWIKLNVSALWSEGEKATSHIALVEDISARVRAKEEREANEKRFKSLVEHSSEVILIIDSEGRAKYATPSLERITGYKQLQIAENEIFSLVHPEDAAGVIKKFKESRNNPGKAVSGINTRIYSRSMEALWVEVTLTNLCHEESIGGYVVNFRDVTAKREAELNLIKSYDFVMEQNKRLLNFAYIVSHNLRSHSSNFESILELYNTEDSEEERQTYISLLQNVSDNLNQSLHDLNEVVSINNNLDINVEMLSVSEYLKNTLDVLKLQINNKEANIINRVPAEMRILFNSSYLESILLNFLTNALRYSAAGRKPEIELLGYQDYGRWVLEIRDNGIGIDLEQHGDKVFGLYKTFTDRKGSRGVGLFITKNQITAMGGTVSVESTPDVGTTFKVMFK
ncbi:PAS domain S-box protein [Christiangramia sabulilitoris]|uniref:histidine kinase n=1 Tax=Christiangramia sabulilitoris TaxID=2583991 RepID=A0A550I0B5_9FLAO|nr:PAS domain S-box protein [Christiangramia sabulilitoris]TRO64258.1 PAS domain S-box protein [Christiangramia sabulilitoris]